ncbi:MAG: hydrogenase maturation nickel metallochaperone HypA [bacterium]
MHELGLAEDILRKIKDEARSRGLSKVSYAKIKVGETLVTDRPELEQLFSMISTGTVAEGVKLDIVISPLKAVCGSCKKEFNPKVMRFDCPSCGSGSIQISSGKELLIEGLK